MMMCINASKEQEEKIFKKYFGPIKDFFNGYVYVSEGELRKNQDSKIEYCGYVTNNHGGNFPGFTKISWQYSPGNDSVCFFTLAINDHIRFDIHYPEGDFKNHLVKISKKARKKFWSGTNGIL